MSLLFVYSLAMTKKCLFPLALALLASCSSPLASSLSSSSEIEVEVPASSSSLEGSSSSEGTTDSDSLGSASSSSLEDVDGEWETIFEKSFEGYEGNELAFFEEGYSTVNSKFGSNYLNLIDPEGYMRTPDIEGLSGEVKVELYCHVTNLNNLTAAAVGETFAFSFSTIAYSIDEDGFSVSDPVDTYSYSHTVTDPALYLRFLIRADRGLSRCRRGQPDSGPDGRQDRIQRTGVQLCSGSDRRDESNLSHFKSSYR